MKRKQLIIFATLATLTLAAIGVAQNRPGDSAPALPGLADGQFLREALNLSAFQVTMGEIAVRQAAAQEFRDYGREMAAVYGRIGRDLEKLAMDKGDKISPEVDTVRQNTAKILAQEHGAGFDRNYMSLMVDENKRGAALFRQAARTSGDRDIREFASSEAANLEKFARKASGLLADLPFPFLK